MKLIPITEKARGLSGDYYQSQKNVELVTLVSISLENFI